MEGTTPLPSLYRAELTQDGHATVFQLCYKNRLLIKIYMYYAHTFSTK